MISLYDLLEASKGQLFGEPVAELFSDFCLDAERAIDGQLFVVRKTKRGDTHRYIRQAIEQGVAGVLCNRPPECDTTGVSVILVSDSTDALLAWARYLLKKSGTKVIAVAGVTGKSMAVDAISRILATQYRVYSNVQAADGQLSVPLALASLDMRVDFAVLKLGITQVGDMAAMVAAAQPEVGLVTGIGNLCVDSFSTPEAFCQDVQALVDGISPGGLAVLNSDDDRLRVLSGQAKIEAKTIGVVTDVADMTARDVRPEMGGTVFELRYEDKCIPEQRIPLWGETALSSVLAALIVGLHYGISIEQGLQTLTGMEPLPGRMNPLPGKNGALLVDDTYSAAPHSTLAALRWLKTVRDQYRRIFFVLGDLQHNGASSKRAYRVIGQEATEAVDVLITNGADAAVTSRAALDYGLDPHCVHMTYTHRDAVSILLNGYNLGEDDLVLLKGQPASHIEQIAQVLLKYPEDENRLARKPLPDWDTVTLPAPTQLSWVEIDTEALAGNVQAVKQMVGDDVAVMAVVKADGYGHGAIVSARTALLNGASLLGVSSLHDAVELRSVGIDAPILAMNHIPVHMTPLAVQQDVTLTLYDLDIARGYDRMARAVNGRVRVHIKIDTGMGRFGVMPDQALRFLRHILTLTHIEVEGICTHFSVADADPEYTGEQLRLFKRTLRSLAVHTGYKFKYIHAANSAALFSNPETHFNLVRPGIALYGMNPSENVQLPSNFRPVLTWKTTIVQVKMLPAGHAVGYGNTYTTAQETRIAVLPVGYADGFRRSPSNWGEVLVHGKRAPLIGRVSMEKATIDVSHILDVAVGDEVVLLGVQGDDAITAEEIAGRLGTVNYEVTCSLLPRAPRR